ncbi:MAG: transcriptional regulator [Sphaerochaetaceae bacterium]
MSSHDNFNKARSKGRLEAFFALLRWRSTELLSLYEVTKLLKPKLETYKGIQPIPTANIIGSEGRYHDFTLAFYPRKDMLRSRWQSIDEALHRQIILPPISVYKLGDHYFVRDGHHRVSVAKMEKVEFIDAEVVELDSQIKIEKGMSRSQLIKRVVEYERDRFFGEYNFPFADKELLKFTSPGMYPEIVNHILVHKYYINETQREEIPFDEAAISWYEQVFLPIVELIKKENILRSYPGRAYGDLYLWIVRHWDDLKHGHRHSISLERALRDFKRKSAKEAGKRWFTWFKEKLSRS